MRLIHERALLLVAVAFAILAGCGSPSPGGETVEFDGAVYFRQTFIDVPAEDVQPIGTAGAVRFDMTSDPTVFSVGDVDPAIAILLRDTTGQGGYHLFMTDNARESEIRARYGQ